MIPTFAEIWQHTAKTGFKELYAKRWRNLSDTRKVYLAEQIKNLKVKPQPKDIIK